MYDYISGTLVSLTDDLAVVDVGGIGYQIRVPRSSSAAVAGRTRVHFHTALRLRDEQFQLYGFATLEEREIFQRVCTIAGIGPGIALAILSGIPIEEFREAVRAGNVKILERIKGVGKKTAQRLILELKEVLVLDAPSGAVSSWPPFGELAVSALVTIGYTQGQAEQAVGAVIEEFSDDSDLGDVVKRATRWARSH